MDCAGRLLTYYQSVGCGFESHPRSYLSSANADLVCGLGPNLGLMAVQVAARGLRIAHRLVVKDCGQPNSLQISS
jgi:hypothetical protein